MLSEHRLRELAERLVRVSGVAGVMLGGSRARGEHTEASDVDLGLYYRPPLDLPALTDLAREVAGPEAELTEPGGWGPWVDGGGWLRIDGVPVDWIYRDLDRVHGSVLSAVAGRLDFHFQVGHPFGVPDFVYAGEVASGVVLADPSGELTTLRAQLADFPPALRQALVARLGEAHFVLGAVGKAASRGDVVYVAGCLFRVVELCAYALCGRAGRWVINEKGAVAAAGRVSDAPAAFAARAHGVLARLGSEPTELRAAVSAAQDLLDEVSAACAG